MRWSSRRIVPDPSQSRLSTICSLSRGVMSAMTTLNHEDAVLLAIHEEMRRDSRVFYMATNGQPTLIKEFGPERARVTPISEEALTGVAIGSAASGLRPVLNWKAFA